MIVKIGNIYPGSRVYVGTSAGEVVFDEVIEDGGEALVSLPISYAKYVIRMRKLGLIPFETEFNAREDMNDVQIINKNDKYYGWE